MPIVPYVKIGGNDMSQFVKKIRHNSTVGTVNGPPSSSTMDITLTSPMGKFTGFWKKYNTVITVAMLSQEFTDESNFSIYATLLFVGYTQDIQYTDKEADKEVVVKAGPMVIDAAGGTLSEYSGQEGVKPSEFVKMMAAEMKIKVRQIDDSPNAVTEMLFDGTYKREDVIGVSGNIDSKVAYCDEHGLFNYINPILKGMNGPISDVSDRLQQPEAAVGVVGFCNQVTVIGGSDAQSSPYNGQVKTISPTYEPQYTTTALDYGRASDANPTDDDATNQAQWLALGDASLGYNPDTGTYDNIIKAPTFYFPDLTTKAACMEKARDLLVYYSARKNTLEDVKVIGRSPHKLDRVLYKIPAGADNIYGSDNFYMGILVEKTEDIDPEAGWITTMKIDPLAQVDSSTGMYTDSQG